MYKKNLTFTNEPNILFYAECDLFYIKQITGISGFQPCELKEETNTKFNRILYNYGNDKGIKGYLFMDFDFENSTVTIDGKTMNIIHNYEFTYKKTRGNNILAVNGIEGFYNTVVRFAAYDSAFCTFFMGALEYMFKVKHIKI